MRPIFHNCPGGLQVTSALMSTLLLLVAVEATAQDTPVRPPLQPSDTSSPATTLRSFIDACNELYELHQRADDGQPDSSLDFLPATERILDCLDLSSLPNELRDAVGTESAIYLKEVLDRIQIPADAQIPLTDESGTPVVRWQIPGTRLTIIRISDGTQEGSYLFSSETVRRASRFYSAARMLAYRDDGPQTSPGLQAIYAAHTKRQPASTADTSSPRGTLTLFLNSTEEIFEVITSTEHWDRTDQTQLPRVMKIYSCLNLTEVPEYSRDDFAGEVSVSLKEILDRTRLPAPEEIPGPEDILSEGKEPLLRWQIPGTQLTIGRVTEGPRKGEYLFTPNTVNRTVSFYEKIRDQPYRTEGRPVSKGFYELYLSEPGHPKIAAIVRHMPSWFRFRAGGMAVWQWLGLTLVIAGCLAIMFFTYRIGLIRSEKVRKTSLARYWATMLFAIVAMLVPLLFKHIAKDYLTIRGTAKYVVDFSADFVFLMALIVVILSVSSRFADSVVALPSIPAQGLDSHLIRILCRVLGIVAAVIVFLEGGRYLGFPITTLLASAGIGGLAVALSAQGMIKGLFGTVTILLDRPYRAGDRIIVGDQDGYVEEIGLRSTKIRTFLTNHIVSIPNDQIADSEVENIGRRKHIRRLCDLHIPLDTPRAHIEAAVASIREVLTDHEGMDPEFPPRVYFNEFNPDSFNIRIIYWYSPPKLWDYLAFCQKVNLQIFKAFEEQGIQFSLPLRHTYWKHDDQQGPLEIKMVDQTTPQV